MTSISTTDQLDFSIKNPTKINLNLTNTNNNQEKSHNQQQLSQLQPITSNPMIVNSHPYNPSQQSQQQRCIGLNQQKQKQQQQIIESSRLLLNSQQNSLYGSSLNHLQQQQQQQQPSPTTVTNTMNRQQQSHMLDLANLQQGVFESAYDIANLNSNQNQSSDRRLNDNMSQNQQQQPNDTSLYSPSSSTSLLYHIYDQINLPSELNSQQQQQQQQQHYQHHDQNQLIGKNNNTTILNPANLFGNNASNATNNNHQQQLITGNNNHQQQPALPLPMQIHQVSELQKSFTQQQQNYYTGQQAFGTLHHQHPAAAYLSSTQNTTNNNLMLDTVMRQHNNAATTLRLQQQQQHHHHQQRPLSSSGASSMSNQSMPITYGRQPRTTTLTTHSTSSGKSQSNLASVLQSSNTLNHLGILNNCSSPNTLNRNQKSLFNNSHDHFRGIKQRLRHYIYEYKTIVKCSILLILLALCLMSIIRFTLLGNNNASPSSSSSFNQPLYISPQIISNQKASQLTPSQSLGISNSLIYPPFSTNTKQSGKCKLQI